jgi:L-threonylcarbamoyladenylate synthase
MAEIVKVNMHDPDAAAIEMVADVLERGEVAVIPTDSVYGIAVAVGLAASPDALFEIKRREPDKAVPLLVSSIEMLCDLAPGIDGATSRLVERFWPGPFTVIVKAGDSVPAAFRAQDGTVAVRMPDAGFVTALIERLGTPLATTSANTSHLPAPASFDEVERRIVDAAGVAVDGGRSAVGIASTIVSCMGTGYHIVREGSVTSDMISEVLEEV